jgi:hypothetical protein
MKQSFRRPHMQRFTHTVIALSAEDSYSAPTIVNDRIEVGSEVPSSTVYKA